MLKEWARRGHRTPDGDIDHPSTRQCDTNEYRGGTHSLERNYRHAVPRPTQSRS